MGRKERSAMMGVVGQDEGAGVVDCGLFEGCDGAMSLLSFDARRDTRRYTISRSIISSLLFCAFQPMLDVR